MRPWLRRHILLQCVHTSSGLVHALATIRIVVRDVVLFTLRNEQVGRVLYM